MRDLGWAGLFPGIAGVIGGALLAIVGATRGYGCTSSSSFSWSGGGGWPSSCGDSLPDDVPMVAVGLTSLTLGVLAVVVGGGVFSQRERRRPTVSIAPTAEGAVVALAMTF